MYFVAGGVLALWFDANGLDLFTSYVAGVSSLSHASPYDHATYVRVWDSLDAPKALADSRAFPFAYPPSWIPITMLLGLLPWSIALACWKLVSAACLVGVVLMTFRLLRADGLDACDRYAVWCFALTLSPTISVMTVGQTSLVVLFALVLSGCARAQGRLVLSGLALALAAIKPQLATAFVVFLVASRGLTVVGIAGVCSALLTWLGLHLSQSDPSTYLVAARKWANDNSPTSHIAVGIASLLAHLTPLDAVTATAIGMLVGVALVGGLAFRHRGADVSQTTAELLPVVLYAAPLCFRCNAYDLVTVIPLFAWSRAHVTPKPLRYAIQALCLVLLVPRAALRIVYDKLAAGVVPYDTYRVGELTFRSWVLVLLLPLVLSALRARFDARSNRAPS